MNGTCKALQARPIFLPAVEGPYPARAKPQFRIVVGGAEWGMYGVPIRPALVEC